MNYGLALSIAMEQQLAKLVADATADSSQQNYDSIDSLQDRALQLAIEQVYQESATVKRVIDESGKETEDMVYHRPWAGGARSLRVGEIILIIDAGWSYGSYLLLVAQPFCSDTIVPEDCFRDAAREMSEEGGESVAIIQHESGI